MRYSIEPGDRIYVKGYGFMSFAKKLSNKYSQKIMDTDKKSTTNAIKTGSQRANQKLTIGNKIDKIITISKKSTKKLPTIDEDAELSTHKKRYISSKERQQIIE